MLHDLGCELFTQPGACAGWQARLQGARRVRQPGGI